jgi:hypothetical protein
MPDHQDIKWWKNASIHLLYALHPRHKPYSCKPNKEIPSFIWQNGLALAPFLNFIFENDQSFKELKMDSTLSNAWEMNALSVKFGKESRGKINWLTFYRDGIFGYRLFSDQ